ncbi:MAG: 4Fe-4S dicluster domain-containing protein [bacterium]
MSTYAMLNDLTKCIGCRACQVACKEWNGLTYSKTYFSNDRNNPVHLGAETYTRIVYTGVPNKDPSAPERLFYRRRMCMHCEEAACVAACPVGALVKTEEGPVVYDEWKCIGCRYCMLACPFSVPRYEWEDWNPAIRKCTFCFDRIGADEEPACSKVCLTDAVIFGPREDIIAEAHKRIAAEPARYQDCVYGEKEVGGTSVMFLSTMAAPLTEIGFRTDLGEQPYPTYSWAALSKVPYIAVFVGVLMSIIYFITHRRMPEAGKKD